MRRRTSAPNPSPRVARYSARTSPAGPDPAHAVADAVVAGQVGGRLGGVDDVVGGHRVGRCAAATPRAPWRRDHEGWRWPDRRPHAPRDRGRRGSTRPGIPMTRPRRSARGAGNSSGGRARVVASRGSCPEIAASTRAASSTVRPKHRDAIERRSEGHQPEPADPAVARLDPDDAAERRRLAHRAAGLRPERRRHDARRDECGRAAARSARHPVGIDRVQHPTVGGMLGGRAHGELVEVRLGRHHAAGGPEPTNHRRVEGRAIALEDPRRAGGGQLRGDDVVLHRDRHPGERPGGSSIEAVSPPRPVPRATRTGRR